MLKLARNVFFTLIASLLVLMPACAGSSQDSPTSARETILITDSIGREVEVPRNVERIAALYSFAGYAVCLFGRGNDLVAVPGGLQRDKLLIRLFPQVANASVPRTGGAINAEELLKIKPDLVLVRSDTVVDEREAEKLDSAHIPYLVIDFSTMDEQRATLMMIGKAIGREAEAKSYDEYYAGIVDRVTRVTNDIPDAEKVRLYYSENQANRTTDTSSVAADWTKASGVINVSVGQDLQQVDSDYYASIEQILLWDPEVIIANETAAYDLIKGHPQWSAVKAVQDGKVYHMPNGISRWGHPGSVETPMALLWTAKTVYPDKFADVDIEEETRYYYQTFFNMDLDDETIAVILKGGDMREPKAGAPAE